MKLYIEGNKPKTLNELLVRLLCFADRGGYYVASATFKDKECKNLQCHAYRIRSFDDILAVSQTYFPKVNAKSLFHRLITFNFRSPKNQPYHFQLAYCITMRKIRFLPYRALAVSTWTDKGNSEFNWTQLLEMLDIKPNYNDLNRYIKKHRKYE